MSTEIVLRAIVLLLAAIMAGLWIYLIAHAIKTFRKKP